MSNHNSIKTKHGEITLPAFMPDATYGAIRNLSFEDVKETGILELVTTTLHLEQKLGSSYVKKMGGVHKFFGWDRPILTDSGGWQVFSLINSNRGNRKNRITKLGCSFVDPQSGKYNLLTPESSISIQLNLGADIITVLDDPIIGDASLAARKESVEITTDWAKRSKNQFEKLTKNVASNTTKPLIGCVIQGADDFENRKISAEQLLELDLDLYNFGGIPLYSDVTWRENSPKGFYREMLAYVSELIPNTKLKYAMGIGQPDDIAFCVEHGWDLFDTVLPTRNARHGFLYVSEGQGDETRGYKSKKTGKEYFYDVMHLRSERYKYDERPIDENVKTGPSANVSRAYLRHLVRIKEPAGFRLATIHNLKFYADWMEMLRI